MWTKHLNAVATQRYTPIYLGDDNPEFPRTFQPTHNNHLLNKANVSADTLIQATNEKINKNGGNTTERTDRGSSPSSPPITKGESQQSIEYSLDYLEFVMNLEKERELQRMLVGRRPQELKNRNMSKVQVQKANQQTESYLQDLLNQVTAINTEKQPYRALFYKSSSFSALLKIKNLNEKLKPLLELLFEKLIGTKIDTIESTETMKHLLRFKQLGEFQGHSTRTLLQTLSSSMKLLAQQQREWNINELTPPPKTRSRSP